MLTYKEYEKAVFDWLMAKNQKDPTFTFSLRKKGSNGAELDYFIGKEKSNYFGMTFWVVPIKYPGLSVDFIDLFFENSKKLKPTYYFQVYQTRSPEGKQNALALMLAKTLKVQLKAALFSVRGSENDEKFERYTIHPRIPDYENLTELFQDLEKDLEIIIPIIDKELGNIKLENPSFIGHRITADEFNTFKDKLIKRLDKYGNSSLLIPTIETPKTVTQTIKMATSKYPLNQILYGPPGTGKTYHTINYAVAIIENTDIESIKTESRKDVLQRFEEYKHKGLVQFITFHQSFSYEDFVEGIKPKTTGEENHSTVIYEIEDGIFKTIANNANSVGQLVHSSERDTLYLSDEALSRINFYKTSLGNSQDSGDDVIYDYCKKNNVIAVGWGDDINFSDVTTEAELKELFLTNGYKPTDFAIIAIKCLKFWMKENDIVFISNGNLRIRAIGQISGDYFYNDETEIRFNNFRPVKWLATDLDIPVEMVYEKKFSQQSIYGMYKEQVKKEFFQASQKSVPDNYVLIIDEINRGNVSQIFGELITLLEEDKRSDAENGMPLSITLPYSKKSFSVPKNLYIVGTMNTADRSVEALDTALRRRFSFQEMSPNYNLKELDVEVIDGVSANQLLKILNSRIEKLLDKDHLIGHSFFINNSKENSLNNVMDAFYRNIIPLLQEYFFGDYGKIGLILGQGFVKKQEAENETIFAKFDYDIETREVYEIVDHRVNPENFKAAIQQLINRN